MPANRYLLPDPEAIHGRLRTYAAGCRCKTCDRVSREFAKARRLDHLDGGTRTAAVLAGQPNHRPTGVVAGAGSSRRLRALVAIGYPPNQLALQLGLLTNEVLDLLYLHRTGTIQTWKAANIAALYDELWDQPQEGSAADRSRIVARREAWQPPLAWDDDEIDNPHARPAYYVETSSRRELPANLSHQHGYPDPVGVPA